VADRFDFPMTKRAATKTRRAVGFAGEMEAGDTVATVSVTAKDEADADVSASLISAPTASDTKVLWTLLGFGVVNATYYIRVVANTTQGDILVKVIKLTINGL